MNEGFHFNIHPSNTYNIINGFLSFSNNFQKIIERVWISWTNPSSTLWLHHNGQNQLKISVKIFLLHHHLHVLMKQLWWFVRRRTARRTISWTPVRFFIFFLTHISETNISKHRWIGCDLESNESDEEQCFGSGKGMCRVG